MNIKHIFFIAIMTTVATITQAAASENQQKIDNQLSLKAWYTSYATTLASSGLIGIITGNLSKHAIRKTLTILKITKEEYSDPTKNIACLIMLSIILVAENKLRKILINETNQNFEYFSINHKKHLMWDFGWFASWLGFFI